MMKQAHTMRVIYPQPQELQDPELSNRKRVFADAMQDKPSEIMVRDVFGEAVSARLRNRKFMDAFQKTESMSIEEKIAHLGKHKTDYPGGAFCFSAEKRPICREGGPDAYWVEIEHDDLKLEGGRKHYSPVLLAEAKGVAIAKKGIFSLRFSDALVQTAKALDLVAPNSTINVNYHLSSEDGMPNEIAEILLDEGDGKEHGTLKICLGGISRKGKRRLGGKQEISGTLFFMLEENALEQAKVASAPGKLERRLDAIFGRMEGFIRDIAPPGIADRLEIYRCLKQVRL